MHVIASLEPITSAHFSVLEYVMVPFVFDELLAEVAEVVGGYDFTE
jgi:hypothetical protein